MKKKITIIDQLKEKAKTGDYYRRICPDKFADLLITEISIWSEMNGGLSPGVDEECLREYLYGEGVGG